MAITAAALVPGNSGDVMRLAGAIFIDAMTKAAPDGKVRYASVASALGAVAALDPGMTPLLMTEMKSMTAKVASAAKANKGMVVGSDFGVDAPLKRLRVSGDHFWGPDSYDTAYGTKKGMKHERGKLAGPSTFKVGADLDLSYLKNIKSRIDTGLGGKRRRPKKTPIFSEGRKPDVIGTKLNIPGKNGRKSAIGFEHQEYDVGDHSSVIDTKGQKASKSTVIIPSYKIPDYGKKKRRSTVGATPMPSDAVVSARRTQNASHPSVASTAV